MKIPEMGIFFVEKQRVNFVVFRCIMTNDGK